MYREQCRAALRTDAKVLLRRNRYNLSACKYSVGGWLTIKRVALNTFNRIATVFVTAGWVALVQKWLVSGLVGAALLAVSPFAVAAKFNWGSAMGGAVSGAAQATSEIADQEIQRKQQQKLIEYQYELEKQRIEQQRQAEEARSPKAMRPPTAEQVMTEELKLTAAHPDWRSTIKTEDFKYWRDYVIRDGKELMASEDAEFIGWRLAQFKEWKRKYGSP